MVVFLGIDIGSSSCKAVVLDEEKNILSQVVVGMGTGTRGVAEVRDGALEIARVADNDIKYTVVTGYGRMTYQYADKQLTEISCHARGAFFLHPGVRTVIDIGGQDAKVIRLNASGGLENFVMNEKCAAGTGRFLEVMARVLGCEIEDLSAIAGQSKKYLAISSVCTVFAESEVISHLASGKYIEDVAAGAILSIAKRISGLANRVGVVQDVVMTGGVAKNPAIIEALSREFDTRIGVPESPQTVGALGAAIFALENYQELGGLNHEKLDNRV